MEDETSLTDKRQELNDLFQTVFNFSSSNGQAGSSPVTIAQLFQLLSLLQEMR